MPAREAFALTVLTLLLASVAGCISSSDSGPETSAGSDEGTAGSTTIPAGIQCSEHPVCELDDEGDNCERPTECTRIGGCPGLLCITRKQACEETCPSLGACTTQQTYPPMLLCEYGAASGKP